MSGGVTTFLLRLVGASPEQKEAEQKFKESLKKHDEADAALDGIVADLERINRKAKKNRELTRTMIPSVRPDATPVPESGTDG